MEDPITSSILTEQFLADTYGVSWQYFPGEPDRFASLLSWPDINRLFDGHWHEEDVVRLLMRRGQPVEKQEYTAPGGWRGRLQVSGAVGALQGGSSLIVEDIASFRPEILELIMNLERVLREEVDSKIFIAGPKTNGLGVHWDPHDVFAVQLLGTRPWRVYRPTLPAPLIADKARTEGDALTHVADIEMRPGDVLYLPRGWWHDVLNSAVPSVHLTLAIHKRAGVDFMAWLNDALCRGRIMRTDLPRFSSPDAQDQHIAELRQLVTEAITVEGMQQFLQKYDDRAAAKRMASLPWGIDPAPDVADADTVVTLVPRARLVDGADGPVLLADGRSLTFAASARTVLERILGASTHQAGDLRAASGIRTEEFTQLIRDLHNQGVVAVRPQG
jgi:Cupin superfamily protein